MNAKIIQRGNGFYAECQIQDGMEYSGPLDTLRAAQDWCRLTEKIMNGNKIKRKQIPIYVEVMTTEMQLVRKK
jgi:hypothetical protein